MKFTKTLGVSLAAAVLALGSASLASAEDSRVTVRVPFDFTAGGSKLPAGRYEITTVGDDAALIAIRSVDGRRSAFLLTTPRATTDQAKPQVVFEKVEQEFVLSQLTLGSTGGHRTTVAPARIKHEREPMLASAGH